MAIVPVLQYRMKDFQKKDVAEFSSKYWREKAEESPARAWRLMWVSSFWICFKRKEDGRAQFGGGDCKLDVNYAQDGSPVSTPCKERCVKQRPVLSTEKQSLPFFFFF